MKKNFFIIFFVLLFALIFIYAFSSSYSSHNIDNICYVIALGIDESNIPNNIKVIFEFIDVTTFSKDSKSDSSSPILEEVTAPSISSAIDVMTSYIGQPLNLSHCKIVVFSENISKQGILTEVSELINDKQVRATTNIVVAKDNSKKYLENSVSSLQKTITKYYDIFARTSSYTGYTSNVILGDFYDSILTKEIGAVAIYGNILPESKVNSKSADSEKNEGSNNNNSTLEDSIVGDKGVENSGLAIFKDDKLIGVLSAQESLCYDILSNTLDTFFTSIDNPLYDEGFVNLSIRMNHNVKINVDTSSDTPIVNIKICLDTKILNILDNVDYNNQETIKIISDKTSHHIEKLISDYLYKCSREYDTDLNNIYKFALKHYLTYDEWKSYNWEDKFKNAIFNIEVDNEITPNLIVSKNRK